MDLNSPEANNLYALLLIGAPVGYITERTIHVAMIKAGGDTEMKGFIARDPVVFLLTLIGSLAALLPATVKYGVSDVVDFLSQSRHEVAMFGWPLTILVVVHVLAPFVVAICLMLGRRKRAKFRSRFDYAEGTRWAS